MKRLEKLIKTAIYFLCCLTTLLPIPRLSRLTTCLRIAVLIWLHINFYVVLKYFFVDNVIVLSDLIVVILFLLNLFTYIVGIVESMVNQHSYGELIDLHCHLDELIGRHLTAAEMANFPLGYLVSMLIVFMLCDALKLWITFTYYVNPVSGYQLLIELGTHMRFVQIILTLVSANQIARNVTTLLKKLIAKNARKSKYGSDIWMPCTPWEYEQLNLLRFLYGRLYRVYGCVEECFAWSIFLIIMDKFFIFVCTIFWCTKLIPTNEFTYGLAYNVLSMVKTGLMITLLCGVTSDVENYSRCIGSLICKLPKPLGNKAYNDLVTSFLIQAFHQKFSIKPKKFFTINRALMGSMISAIHTYLVILIQFLLAVEKPRNENQ